MKKFEFFSFEIFIINFEITIVKKKKYKKYRAQQSKCEQLKQQSKPDNRGLWRSYAKHSEETNQL